MKGFDGSIVADTDVQNDSPFPPCQLREALSRLNPVVGVVARITFDESVGDGAVLPRNSSPVRCARHVQVRRRLLAFPLRLSTLSPIPLHAL